MMPEQTEQLLKSIMDPSFFAIKDSSLATVAKLGRDFEEELLGEFSEKKMSKTLVRNGVVNIIIDAKKQKESFLMVNFGVEAECTDLTPYDGVQGKDLIDMLSNARQELLLSKPPTPTLECSYREFQKVSARKSITKVIIKSKLNKLFIL